ncbi:MAG: cbb3-type cytochrome oxidase assembly protein CcoS [Bernardetiaceae bacterium]
MEVIFILIGVSLVVALGFLGSFVWSVRSGQFDDTSTPGIRILLDDEYPNTTSANAKEPD